MRPLLLLLLLLLPPRSTSAARALISITSKANNKYVRTNSDGANDLSPSRSGLSTWETYTRVVVQNGTSSMFAFLCESNGKYMSVQEGLGGTLTATATAPGPWEQFTVEDAGGGFSALLSGKTGRYVTATNAGSGNLQASTAATIGPWEMFVLSPVVDVMEVASAFANNYPNFAKNCTGGFCTGLWQHRERVHNGQLYWLELFPWPQAGQTVYNLYGLQTIGEWEIFTSWATRPDFQGGAVWNIPRSRRYLNPAIEEQSPVATGARYQTATPPNCSKNLEGSADEWGTHSKAYMRDVGGDVGSRWVIDIRYKTTNEMWAVDLGPSPFVYEPKWGVLAYSDPSGRYRWMNTLSKPTSKMDAWPECLPTQP